MHLPVDASALPAATPASPLVVCVQGPLTADAVVDAHLRAVAQGRALVLRATGDATPAAARMAARFGAVVERERPVVVGPPAAWGVAAGEDFDPPAPTEMIEAASEPEPEVAHLTGPALPWDPLVAQPEPVPVTVAEDEFEAMPWNVVHHQLLPAGRHTRTAAPRPTTTPDWGLPWPRPVAPSDGLALADPRLWHARERVGALRDDLDRAGAPSFGVAKPEGSAWLKRLHEFGSP